MVKRAKHRFTRVMISFGLSLAIPVMVFGLLMPVIGPAVDHHYADRSPEHTHLLVGEKTNLHEHLLTGHRHISVDVNGDGISVTSTSVSPAYGSLTLDGATLELLIPGYSPHMVAIQVGAPVIPDDEAIAPLDRPPRRA